MGVASSSARYKQNILPIAVAESEKVHQLRPVSFHYKTEASGPLQYGLIAEEVAKVYPDLVTWDETGEITGVRYEALTPILLKELQGQHQQMQAVLQQVATQAQQLADLKLQNDSLRAAVERLQGAETVALTTASNLQ